MKKCIGLMPVFLLLFISSFAQQKIAKKTLENLQSELKKSPLLVDGDIDFRNVSNTKAWGDESAVILCQKTCFEFDKKGLSAGKRIGRNVVGLLFALPTLGTSIFFANARNETSILVEETERKKILLKDKYALEQYSILYFRIEREGDAFAARVVKRDGTIVPVSLSESIQVEDAKTVPTLFRSYTDAKIGTNYRPDFYKIAVPDLEEGDIIEYEFRNFNSQNYNHNPRYKEFMPVYYLCNREVPVNKQIIEVSTADDKYYIGFKSLKGAPAFQQSTKDGKSTYRWVDENRERSTDVRFVNEFLEQPSIKFQMVYARKSNKGFVWFKDAEDMKREMTTAEITEKAKNFWFEHGDLQSVDNMNGNSSESSLESTIKSMYKSVKKNGITDAGEDDYVNKVYYYIRSKTLYSNISSFDFAKIFSGMLEQRKIDHDIVVTTSNQQTKMGNIAFTQELHWVIKYKNHYYANPDEHLNPQEIPSYLNGNEGIRFNYKSLAGATSAEPLPVSDTNANLFSVIIKASLDEATRLNLQLERGTEVKGLSKEAVEDEVLALTPFMENDYRNYDGTGMFEGLSAKEEEKAMEEVNRKKKEWKEEKPIMMKALVEDEYGYSVEKYNQFKLVQDGRHHKKRNLKYFENFVLADMTSSAGEDIVLALPSLVGGQTRIKPEEKNRTLPVDIRYAHTLQWSIAFTIPSGYTVKGIESLNVNVGNELGAFTSSVTVNGNLLQMEIKKVYKVRHMESVDWGRLLPVLEAAYNFSQSKIVLKKGA